MSIIIERQMYRRYQVELDHIAANTINEIKPKDLYFNDMECNNIVIYKDDKTFMRINNAADRYMHFIALSFEISDNWFGASYKFDKYTNIATWGLHSYDEEQIRYEFVDGCEHVKNKLYIMNNGSYEQFAKYTPIIWDLIITTAVANI